MKNLLRVTFEVKRIQFHSDKGEVIAKVAFVEYPTKKIPTRDPVIVGSFISILEGDEYEATGYWEEHPWYGLQFIVMEAKRIFPETFKGMIKFIQKQVKGLGKVTATRIVETFEYDTFDVIQYQQEKLTSIKGLNKEKIEKLHEVLKGYKEFEEFLYLALQSGANYNLALDAYTLIQNVGIREIKRNPYLLIDIPSWTFQKIDQLASQMDIPFSSLIRAKASILYYLEENARNNGNLFAYEDVLKRNLSIFIQKRSNYKKEEDQFFSQDTILMAIQQLSNEKKITKKIAENKSCLYLKKYEKQEQIIIQKLKERIEHPLPIIATKEEIDKEIKKIEIESSFVFADKQKKAIHMTLSNGISILTGGPGTGKTQTINAILRIYKTFAPRHTYYLAAPTGRAAQRIAELTKEEAKTLHRLLYIKNEHETSAFQLKGNLLIVDEFSMVDVFLAHEILTRVEDSVRLLFVGDVDQLPPVGAGLILRDMIDSHVIPNVALNQIFRQSENSSITINADAIKKGHLLSTVGGYLFSNQKDSSSFFIKREGPNNVKKTLLLSIQRFLQRKDIRVSDIQVLTPINNGPLGVEALNQMIQEKINPESMKKAEYITKDGVILREGDPIMQLKNNYTLHVDSITNGEVGVLHDISKTKEGEIAIEVHYGNKEVVYKEKDLDQINLAYAATVHKAQGTENKIVFVIVDEQHEKQNFRNTLFTAVTRAREKLIIIGQVEAFNKAVQEVSPMIRNSNIAHALQEAFPQKHSRTS